MRALQGAPGADIEPLVVVLRVGRQPAGRHLRNQQMHMPSCCCQSIGSGFPRREAAVRPTVSTDLRNFLLCTLCSVQRPATGRHLGGVVDAAAGGDGALHSDGREGPAGGHRVVQGGGAGGGGRDARPQNDGGGERVARRHTLRRRAVG
jgi:hypothetical protein